MTTERQPSPETWAALLRRHPHTPLLQSWAWGEFQRRVGRPPRRVLISDSGEPVVGFQAFVHRYPLGFRSLYVPQGPVFASADRRDDALAWRALSQALAAVARSEAAVFVRLEPPDPLALGRWLPVRSVRSVQPSTTHVLDLRQPESGLLAAMHRKTRYNIRLAQRHGLQIEERGARGLGEFLRLLTQTEARQGVRFFSPSYFRALFATPELTAQTRLSCATLNGRALASIVVIAEGDTATYLHGGSSREARAVMAPHLIHWQAIRDAKAAGLTWYDFRGVAPADAPDDHPWAGFSRFKRGFGGVDIEYPGAFDWVRRPFWYLTYRSAQRLGLRTA